MLCLRFFFKPKYCLELDSQIGKARVTFKIPVKFKYLHLLRHIKGSMIKPQSSQRQKSNILRQLRPKEEFKL